MQMEYVPAHLRYWYRWWIFLNMGFGANNFLVSRQVSSPRSFFNRWLKNYPVSEDIPSDPSNAWKNYQRVIHKYNAELLVRLRMVRKKDKDSSVPVIDDKTGKATVTGDIFRYQWTQADSSWAWKSHGQGNWERSFKNAFLIIYLMR